METEQEPTDIFNPTTTASKSDKWILNQALLNMWFNQLLPAMQKWEEAKLRGNYERELNPLRSTMTTLLSAIRSSLDKEFLKKKDAPYDKTRNIITHLQTLNDDTHEEEMYEIIDIIEEFLYSKGLTKWDTKEVQDRTQVWKMNQRFLG